ncbi:MAG: beta-N-acetylhexosaminidase [Actinobacteria bacterium]|nr:beta-N-acetylhexosaminidase [Actinomycetota bacterium]
MSQVRISRDGSLPAQGYRLRVNEGDITIDAADDAGERYAKITLDQIRSGSGRPGMIYSCEIVDWPDFPVRAVMVDISRCKVPTMKTLKDLIGRLAGWKINQLQLYTEHTFAYRGHEEVWRSSSPLTAEEVLELDRHCLEHGVELVANQNCLGHMERWLVHKSYRHLAMAPEGFTDPFGLRRSPSTLEPKNPGAIGLIRDLLGQLLENFKSSRVHVGLDEPWELGSDRIDDYAGWLEDLVSLQELSGKEILIWGDVLAAHPSLCARVPGEVTVCEWGYEAGHPFELRLERLAEAGCRSWVCAGTSSWLSLLGRTSNMLANCAQTARAGLDHGAVGYMCTDWGDLGHLQYLPVSEPGFAFAAGCGWCVGANANVSRDELAEVLDLVVFDDPNRRLSSALLDLGDAYLKLECQFPNLSTAVVNLYFPQMEVGKGLTAGISQEGLDALEGLLTAARAELELARPRSLGAGLVVQEIETAIDLQELCCMDASARLAGDGSLGSISTAERARLAGLLDDCAERHRELWLARNRSGGLSESLEWLAHLLSCYRAGSAERTWAGPLSQRFFDG